MVLVAGVASGVVVIVVVVVEVVVGIVVVVVVDAVVEPEHAAMIAAPITTNKRFVIGRHYPGRVAS